MKLLITGATGLIGTEIMNLCIKKGYDVHYLTTSKEKIKNSECVKGFYWNPKTQEIDTDCIRGITTIINLAGASVSKKWTLKHKEAILNSRIDTVKLLYKLLSENKNEVTHFATSSALGIYPSSLEKKYDETEMKTNLTFLGEVVNLWEKEADNIRKIGITVSKLRTGIVLSKKGGALVQMVKPIGYGLGAALGSGQQYQSWIHIYDMANMYLYIIENSIEGIFNAIASEPITNKNLTKAIAKQLNKSLWLPNIPVFMVKLILGEMSTIALESHYLLNEKIKNTGFVFKFDTIGDALEDCLM